MKIVLASSSPYRKELLKRLNLEFETIAPKVDESAIQSQKLDPEKMVEALSILKAQQVAQSLESKDNIIIASDQVAYAAGEVLGKPGNKTKAKEQLMMLQGKEHKLYTGLVVMKGDEVLLDVDVTTLKMRNLTEDQVKKYVDLDSPIDCAGSYKIERSGILLFDEIQTKDHTSIQGLPLLSLTKFLANFDVQVL